LRPNTANKRPRKTRARVGRRLMNLFMGFT
jgi:hypothetical protein